MHEGNAPRHLSESRVVVAGVIRNGEQVLASSIERLRSALSDAAEIHWVVIESDSSDSTADVLSGLRNSIQNFRFESLGDLRQTVAERTERLAICRNRYLEIINSTPALDQADFVVVADLDGINDLVDAAGLNSCWLRGGWDACFANQAGPYYDIWTLRHPDWCPGNSRSEFHFLNSHERASYRNLQASVFSRMIRVQADADWIPVRSAFGGLGIYRRSSLRNRRYSHLDEFGQVCCEHVPLNLDLSRDGGRLYINPMLINSGFNEHSRQVKLRPRLLRRAKLTTLDAIWKHLGSERHDLVLKLSTHLRETLTRRR